MQVSSSAIAKRGVPRHSPPPLLTLNFSMHVSSLRFGQRCSTVTTTAQQQQFVEAPSAENTALRVAAAHAALADLESRGMGETFGADCAESEINLYKQNCAKLDELKRDLIKYQRFLFETKAKAKRIGGGESRGSKKIKAAVGAAAVRVGEAKNDITNIGDIILRQKSIKGFVRPPNNLYVKKLAELQELQMLANSTS